YRTNLFLDCTAEYRLRDVTLTLKGVNLLDSKVFRKFSDNGIISRSTEYHLRGRMLLAGVRFSIR
ncbi:MAG: hypothetical protein K2G69_04975, partial [Muribaculaceae bacterium]|nr:hypothetical protein [Muribaculaceae bacterium]